MYENGALDGTSQDDIHTAAIAFHIRSLDFNGQRYDAVKKIGEISVNSARVVGWGNLSYSFPIFDKRYRSREGVWLPLQRRSQE
jgi:hypothetical protein